MSAAAASENRLCFENVSGSLLRPPEEKEGNPSRTEIDAAQKYFDSLKGQGPAIVLIGDRVWAQLESSRTRLVEGSLPLQIWDRIEIECSLYLGTLNAFVTVTSSWFNAEPSGVEQTAVTNVYRAHEFLGTHSATLYTGTPPAEIQRATSSLQDDVGKLQSLTRASIHRLGVPPDPNASISSKRLIPVLQRRIRRLMQASRLLKLYVEILDADQQRVLESVLKESEWMRVIQNMTAQLEKLSSLLSQEGELPHQAVKKALLNLAASTLIPESGISTLAHINFTHVNQTMDPKHKGTLTILMALIQGLIDLPLRALIEDGLILVFEQRGIFSQRDALLEGHDSCLSDMEAVEEEGVLFREQLALAMQAAPELLASKHSSLLSSGVCTAYRTQIEESKTSSVCLRHLTAARYIRRALYSHLMETLAEQGASELLTHSILALEFRVSQEPLRRAVKRLASSDLASAADAAAAALLEELGETQTPKRGKRRSNVRGRGGVRGGRQGKVRGKNRGAAAAGGPTEAEPRRIPPAPVSIAATTDKIDIATLQGRVQKMGFSGDRTRQQLLIATRENFRSRLQWLAEVEHIPHEQIQRKRSVEAERLLIEGALDLIAAEHFSEDTQVLRTHELRLSFSKLLESEQIPEGMKAVLYAHREVVFTLSSAYRCVYPADAEGHFTGESEPHRRARWLLAYLHSGEGDGSQIQQDVLRLLEAILNERDRPSDQTLPANWKQGLQQEMVGMEDGEPRLLIQEELGDEEEAPAAKPVETREEAKMALASIQRTLSLFVREAEEPSKTRLLRNAQSFARDLALRFGKPADDEAPYEMLHGLLNSCEGLLREVALAVHLHKGNAEFVREHRTSHILSTLTDVPLPDHADLIHRSLIYPYIPSSDSKRRNNPIAKALYDAEELVAVWDSAEKTAFIIQQNYELVFPMVEKVWHVVIDGLLKPKS